MNNYIKLVSRIVNIKKMQEDYIHWNVGMTIPNYTFKTLIKKHLIQYNNSNKMVLSRVDVECFNEDNICKTGNTIFPKNNGDISDQFVDEIFNVYKNIFNKYSHVTEYWEKIERKVIDSGQKNLEQ